MSASVSRRPFPFPELEVTHVCKNVSAATITAKTTPVRLVGGQNTSGATLDGIIVDEWISDEVVEITVANYPSAEDDGPLDNNLTPAFIGIPLVTAADDAFTNVVFRGLIRGLVPATALTAARGRGSLIVLDASNSYLPEVVDEITLADDDIIIGRLATRAASLATTIDVFWDGIFAREAAYIAEV